MAAADALEVNVKLYPEGGDTLEVETEMQDTTTTTLHIGVRMMDDDGEIQLLYYSVVSVQPISVDSQEKIDVSPPVELSLRSPLEEADGNLPFDTLMTSRDAVRVHSIPRGVESLYAALAHQIYHTTIGSPEHAQNTSTLRHMSHVQLRTNLARYRRQMLQSVLLHGDRYAQLPTENARLVWYLRDLQTPGFPPGTEFVQAVADIVGVNVMVYPKDGAPYLIESSGGHNVTTIRIAQRLVEGEDGRVHYHYDSVEIPRHIAEEVTHLVGTKEPESYFKLVDVGDRVTTDGHPSPDIRTTAQVYRPDVGQQDASVPMLPRGSILTSTATVTVVRMPQDHDSLYSALVHQIHRHSSSSQERAVLTSRLRSTVQDHLNLHHPQYVELMSGAVSSLGEPSTGVLTENVIEPGFHPGSVVIQAAADLLGVDVKVYPEDGAPYVLRSKADNVSMTTRISQVLVTGPDGRTYLHYDSVLGVRHNKTMDVPTTAVDGIVEDISHTEPDTVRDQHSPDSLLATHDTVPEILTTVHDTGVIPAREDITLKDTTADLSSEENAEKDASVLRAADEIFLTDTHPVKILSAGKDGDSLYAAVAHQMYQHPIGSPMHANITAWLRNIVQSQLLLKWVKYRDLVLKSVSSHGELYENLLLEDAKIQQYLQDLGEPGFPPGEEAIQLLADFLRVNVLVYREGGSVYLVYSRAPHVRMVIRIGRRLAKGRDGKMRHHYGSIIIARTPDIRHQLFRKDHAEDSDQLKFNFPYEDPAVPQDIEKPDDEQMVKADFDMDGIEEAIITSSEVVTILRVPRDGDSLFAALAHQLKLNPIGSPEHRQDTLTLRTDVWLELLRNFPDYTDLVHRSMQLHRDRYLNFPSTEEKMDEYLWDLQRPGFPGGVEVIQVTANLEAIDVIVFLEGGDGYLVESSTRPSLRVLTVVQRLVQAADHSTRLHYDSVVAVGPIENIDSHLGDEKEIVTHL